MDDWRLKSAAEQGRAIASGAVDPRDLTEAYLAAIKAHPDRDRIYARTTPERARAEAASAAERQKSGRLTGPLDGVPISWKDLYDTAGVPTEGGTRLMAGRIPDADAEVVRRGTAAGTVCLGKTHTTEIAFSGLGVNPMTATPPNAIEPALAPGGSSSGAAVSTKLGIAAAGIGSDTGGSVRIPAAWNDLVGLKTTAGLIPIDGVIALSPTFDTVGPLTRTVEDAALLFSILADLPVPDWEGGALTDEPLHLVETVVLYGCDDGVLTATDGALDYLAARGARVTRGKAEEFQRAMDVLTGLSALVPAEAWEIWGPLIEAQPGVMWPPIEARCRLGQNADPETEAKARAAYQELARAVQARIEAEGLLVAPTCAILPPASDRLLADMNYFSERNLMALRNTRFANLFGLSSLTVPTGTPMCGLMLLGPPNGEGRLLRAGRAIEEALAG